MAGNVSLVWLDLPCDQLMKANVRGEAKARGLLLRAGMWLYYRHDKLRASDFLFHWEVAPNELREIWGGNRCGQFLEDLRKALRRLGVIAEGGAISDLLG
jgi:hypothetical protein